MTPCTLSLVRLVLPLLAAAHDPSQQKLAPPEKIAPLVKVAPSVAIPEALRAPIAPDKMREDAKAWREGLRNLCAGLHRYITPVELDQAFAELDAQLEQDLPLIEFYRAMMRVNSQLRRRQAVLGMPSSITTEDYGEQSRVPPVRVSILGERFFVVGTLGDSPGLPPGSELVEINGYPVATIRETIYGCQLGEGFNESGKRWRVEKQFPLDYILFVDDQHTTFAFRYRDPEGVEREATLDGVPGVHAFDAAMPDPARPRLAFEVLAGGDAALLTVRTLHERSLEEVVLHLPTFLEQSFAAMREQKVERLILDLRGTDTGSDENGVLLVSYLAREPFQYFKFVEVSPTYTGNQDTAQRSDGTQVLYPYPGMAPTAPLPEAYRGELIVLIDGGTYGTAADVASTLHRLRRATLVGEETGGVYDGSCGGSQQKIMLANTRFAAYVPSFNYILAGDEDELRGLGVPPDHEVIPTVADVLAGEDAVLRYVREKLLAR